MKLIKEGLPVNAKNYFLHSYTKDTRDNLQFPKTGSFLSIVNEFAYGADNRFHKLDLKFLKYFGITSNIVFQTSAVFGYFVDEFTDMEIELFGLFTVVHFRPWDSWYSFDVRGRILIATWILSDIFK